MGNNLTKESGTAAGANHAAGTISGHNGSSSSKSRNSHTHCEGGSGSPHRRSGRSHHGHSSSSKHKKEGYEQIIDPNETVDGGYLFPQGVYSGGQDYKVSNVRNIIIQRKMAPFYKGLDSVDPNWTDEESLEHVKGVQPKHPPKDGQPGPPTPTQQIWLYRNVHECPICFLMYPRLNGTRCCGQEICTECFVQIKRNPPHPPYTSNADTEATDVLELLSEPAACPYCAQSNLGIIFEAPPFEWGIPSSSSSPKRGSPMPQPTSHSSSKKPANINSTTSNGTSNHTNRSISSSNGGSNRNNNHTSDNAPSHSASSSQPSSKTNSVISTQDENVPTDAASPGSVAASATTSNRKRRHSVPATHSSVVTVDMIRPDWEDKLASARRRLARKSAAARALHQAALLPNNQNGESIRGLTAHAGHTPSSPSRTRSQDPGLASIVQATRMMSIEQTRALEQKMLEEAIKASLNQH